MVTPPAKVIDAVKAPSTRVLRRVDIFEQDGITPFMMNAKFVGGAITADQARDERRNLDLTLFNENGELDAGPGKFWYDKVIKVYRGVVATDGTNWLTQVGEFQIDRISEKHFPSKEISITGRDYTKKLINSKFRYTTLYEPSDPLELAVQSIAYAAGVRKFNLPTTGIVLDSEVIFEQGTTRWEAIKQICQAASYEPFFQPDGRLTIKEYADPSSASPALTLDIGPNGVLVSYSKEATDARLRNVVVVTGESTDTIPVTAVAANHAPGSPTSVEEVGERVDMITSPLIVRREQAQKLADNLLAIASLEEFNINFTSLVFPWLDVGNIIDLPAIDNGSAYYSTSYLLSTITIPLGLGPMSGNGKRVVLIKRSGGAVATATHTVTGGGVRGV